MKSKLILITILFSLLLNIGHDFILYEETKDNCISTLQQPNKIIEDSCCSKIADIHNSFHFFGIIESHNILFLGLLHNPISQKFLYPTEVYFNSFKPPRA